MVDKTREWAEEAINLCSRAREKGVSIVMARCQDINGDCDIAVTNVDSPEILEFLAECTDLGHHGDGVRQGDKSDGEN